MVVAITRKYRIYNIMSYFPTLTSSSSSSLPSSSSSVVDQQDNKQRNYNRSSSLTESESESSTSTTASPSSSWESISDDGNNSSSPSSSSPSSVSTCCRGRSDDNNDCCYSNCCCDNCCDNDNRSYTTSLLSPTSSPTPASPQTQTPSSSLSSSLSLFISPLKKKNKDKKNKKKKKKTKKKADLILLWCSIILVFFSCTMCSFFLGHRLSSSLKAGLIVSSSPSSSSSSSWSSLLMIFLERGGDEEEEESNKTCSSSISSLSSSSSFNNTHNIDANDEMPLPSIILLKEFLNEWEGIQHRRSLPRFVASINKKEEEEAEENVVSSVSSASSSAKTATTKRKKGRRKQYAESVIHPILLLTSRPAAAKTKPQPKSIAIACNTYEEANDLLSEIILYQSIKKITILFVGRRSSSSSRSSDNNNKIKTEMENDNVSCPRVLKDIVTAATATAAETNTSTSTSTSTNIDIDCLYIDDYYGEEGEEKQKQKQMQKQMQMQMQMQMISNINIIGSMQYDVSIVLNDCDNDDDNDGRQQHHQQQLQTIKSDNIYDWEEVLYSKTKLVALKCVGGRTKNDPNRMNKIHKYFIDINNNIDGDGDDEFVRIIDYDVISRIGSTSSSKTTTTNNLVIAFRSKEVGLPEFRSNEAWYMIDMHKNWRHHQHQQDYSNNFYFDAADIVRIQYPSKQSANSYCDYYFMNDNNNHQQQRQHCQQQQQHGYDPYVENISFDKLYVNTSTLGENVGRGVFTSVDIDIGSYITIENTIYDVIMDYNTSELTENMLEYFCPDDSDWKDSYNSSIVLSSFYCIAGIYADVYGFNTEPWGVPETRVNTHLLTFANHGCNGTANTGYNPEGTTEFTLLQDYSPEDNIEDDDDDDAAENSLEASFVPPDNILQSKQIPKYSPIHDRNYIIMDRSFFHQVNNPIMAHTELLENYIFYDGDSYLLENLIKLKNECSGQNIGDVVNYERNKLNRLV